jgi:hypothetical protein
MIAALQGDTKLGAKMPTTYAPQTEENEEFTRFLVDAANANNASLMEIKSGRLRMGEVRRLIADNEVVFAVWQETNGDVGTLLIKGSMIARKVLSENLAGITAKVTAIKCIEAEQAVALQEMYGDQTKGLN